MLSKADIKLIKSLSDRAARREHGLFVVEGAKMAGEALASGAGVGRLFVSGETGMRFADDIAMRRGETGGEKQVRSKAEYAAAEDAYSGNVPAPEHISPSEMERISHLKTPPGILALVEIPRNEFDERIMRRGLVLALDAVQDPGNLGTIIRIADWFGIGDIVCSPGSADCYNPKTVQATMGALFRTRIHYMELPAFLSRARSGGIPVYGAALDGEDVYSANLTPNGIIVMGSESHGISPETDRLLSRKLLIPSYPPGRRGSESLNVATATAIICAEFRRRER